MKRLIVLLLMVILTWGMGLGAADFKENHHYARIVPEPPIGKSGDKIEVVEFFMYTCPHCYHFEPTIKAWLANNPGDVEFVRVPAMFGGVANLHAKAYYALEALGELERVHEAFFAEIHKKRNRLADMDALVAFVTSQGIAEADFRAAMDSFAVAAKTNRANALMRRYDIRAVPKLVIDGRYRTERGLSMQGLVEVTDYLLNDIRQQKQETP